MEARARAEGPNIKLANFPNTNADEFSQNK